MRIRILYVEALVSPVNSIVWLVQDKSLSWDTCNKKIFNVAKSNLLGCCMDLPSGMQVFRLYFSLARSDISSKDHQRPLLYFSTLIFPYPEQCNHRMKHGKPSAQGN